MLSSHSIVEVASNTTIGVVQLDDSHYEFRLTTMGDDAETDTDHRVDLETCVMAFQEMWEKANKFTR